MISKDTVDQARLRYDAQRLQHIARTPEARARLDDDACHDVALDLGLDYEELREALGESSKRVDGL